MNVTYAGFIGSVTGMNAKQVSIGEMGGAGLGHWAGVPMAFLVRMALEEADDLDEAIADLPRQPPDLRILLRDRRRQDAARASAWRRRWDRFGVIRMGEAHPRLPHAVQDAVLLSAGDRYEELARRVKAGHGTFDAESARDLMGRPGGDEVEPAQRPVRDEVHAALGRQRLEGRRAGRDSAVSRVLLLRASEA